MKLHNLRRCLITTLFAIATWLAATPGQALAAQAAEVKAESAPSPAAAMAAYRALESWVRAWKVPDAVPADLAGLPGGAHVQLRLNGELIGRGQAFPATGETGGAALAAAAREALQAASAKLVLPNDAMRDEALKVQAGLTMISLDLAGPLQSFEPARWSDAEVGISPGLEGVAAAVAGPDGRVSDLAAAFPSYLIATNTLPHRALAGLCAQVIGEGGAAAALDEPQRIRAKHGVRMYRFRTTHLAQCKPGAEPVFLYRGARLVDQSEVTTGELRLMGELMAGHLAATRRQLSGDQAALAALALRRYGSLMRALAGGDLPTIWTSAHELVSRFDDRGSFEDATALLLLLAESPDFCGPSPVAVADKVRADRNQSLRSRAQIAKRPAFTLFGASPVAMQGLQAAVYATYPELSQTNERATVPVLDVDSSIRQLHVDMPPGQLVSHMPWLGWAEIELAKRKAEAGGQADIPSAIALREMRRQVWEHQIGMLDLDRDSLDMGGGIVFTKGATPLPTWQCTRPLAFIATMLGDERLTEPHERPLELARLMISMRFLRQLMADESIGWMARNPDRAIGGVRAAPWDQSMPPDATSMALLAVVEAIKSLEKLESMPRQESQPANEPARP